MCDIVGSQHGVTGKTFAAHFTGIRFFTGVRSIVNFEALRGLQLLAAQCAKVLAPLAVRWDTMSPDLVLLQHRPILINLAANVAFVLGLVLARFLKLLVRCRIIMIETIVFLQTVHVIEDAIASVATLQKIVRRRVCD